MSYSTLYCMNDDPFEMKWQELVLPLGVNWDLDEQCRKDFGDGFRLCSRVSGPLAPIDGNQPVLDHRYKRKLASSSQYKADSVAHLVELRPHQNLI